MTSRSDVDSMLAVLDADLATYKKRKAAELDREQGPQNLVLRALDTDLARAQAAIIEVSSDWCTLKHTVCQSFALMEARRSPRRSKSKTSPSAARTFSDIEPWPALLVDALLLEESLDDTKRQYRETTLTITGDNKISAPADEGSGCALSFTDLVVRKSGQVSNEDHLSALILGAGEVKGDWQLSPRVGEQLQDMIQDPKRINSCVLALQQAYGDAILDDAPLMFVSNYHCTFFLKRSDNVFDKRLWASEPIWWDRQQPSACSCWLAYLQLAEQMLNLKPKLPRQVVPQTADGYELPLVSTAQHPKGKNILRSRPQATIKLKAKSKSSKGYDIVHNTARNTSLRQRQFAEMAGHHRAVVGKVEAEPEVSCGDLGLTDTRLSDGQYGQTMLGHVAGKACAVKLYDSRQPGALQAYFQEKWCLQTLRSQASIVSLQMAGRLQHTLYPCIVTVFAGRPVTRLSRAQRIAAKKALSSLHDAGACHGDIRLPNILFKQDGSCLLADLAHCVMNSSVSARQQEQLQLARLP